MSLSGLLHGSQERSTSCATTASSVCTAEPESIPDRMWGEDEIYAVIMFIITQYQLWFNGSIGLLCASVTTIFLAHIVIRQNSKIYTACNATQVWMREAELMLVGTCWFKDFTLLVSWHCTRNRLSKVHAAYVTQLWGMSSCEGCLRTPPSLVPLGPRCLSQAVVSTMAPWACMKSAPDKLPWGLLEVI